MGSLKGYAVKSKGMPGVTANKTGTTKSKQMAKPIQAKYDTKRRHA